MTPSNFSFLQKEFPLLHNLAAAAEYNLYTDPVGSLVKLRQFGGKLTEFVYEIINLTIVWLLKGTTYGHKIGWVKFDELMKT
jgi:hypothetical protein